MLSKIGGTADKGAGSSLLYPYSENKIMAQDSTTPENLSSTDIEERLTLKPNFDANGLVTCVSSDPSGLVLMVAHMNAEALSRTIETGEAWYFSRSRKTLWRKGERSGHTQRVVEMRVDCDQDAIWIVVEQFGPGACHTGRKTCFYRQVPVGNPTAVGSPLALVDADRTFDPKSVYSGGKAAR